MTNTKLNQINQHIEQIIRQDRQNGDLKSILMQQYGFRGTDWVAHHCNYLQAYIQFAPGNLINMWQAARTRGREKEIAPIVDMLIHYFFKSDDYIPDRFGAIGWLDDAYLCNYTLELINRKCKTQFGYHLLDFDFEPCNAAVAPFLGNTLQAIQRDAEQAVNKTENWNAVELLAGAVIGGLLLYGMMNSGNNNSSGSGGGSYSRQMDSRIAALTSGTDLYPF